MRKLISISAVVSILLITTMAIAGEELNQTELSTIFKSPTGVPIQIIGVSEMSRTKGGLIFISNEITGETHISCGAPPEDGIINPRGCQNGAVCVSSQPRFGC